MSARTAIALGGSVLLHVVAAGALIFSARGGEPRRQGSAPVALELVRVEMLSATSPRGKEPAGQVGMVPAAAKRTAPPRSQRVAQPARGSASVPAPAPRVATPGEPREQPPVAPAPSEPPAPVPPALSAPVTPVSIAAPRGLAGLGGHAASADDPGAGTEPGTDDGAGQGRAGGSAMVSAGSSGATSSFDASVLHARLAAAARSCYPPAARRFRLTGSVPVSFCVTGSGGVERLERRGTSSSDLLDRAALECVLVKAAPLPGPAQCYSVSIEFR